MNQLINFLNDIFVVKAPALPVGFKDFLVKAAPYLAIVSIIVAIPAILAVFGMSFVAVPFMTMYGLGTTSLIMWFFLALAIVNIILTLMAIPGLFAKAMRGWTLIFYTELISGINNLISFSLFGLLLTALTMYFLFQIKSYYNGSSAYPPSQPPMPPQYPA